KQVEVIAGNEDVRSLAFLPREGGLRLATGNGNGTVRIWDLPGREALSRPDRPAGAARALNALGHQCGIYVVAVAPDGKTIATGTGDHTSRLWDAGTGKEARRLEGHTDGVGSLCYSRDGKLLASAGRDGRVFVREAATGKTLHRLQGRCVAFSPD